jgi:hypothetical protein
MKKGEFKPDHLKRKRTMFSFYREQQQALTDLATYYVVSESFVVAALIEKEFLRINKIEARNAKKTGT